MEFQVTYEAAMAYNNLYTEVDGLLQAWGSFWRKTATEVSGLSNVIGFELINEPFAGNVYTNPLLSIPYFADRWRLQPAYDTLARYIREVDSRTLIFFAGVTWEHLKGLRMGFAHAPGGHGEANRSVIAYHFYPGFGLSGHFPKLLAQRRKEAVKLGTGLMMTESCCSSFWEAAEHLSAAGHSWIQWEWKEWCTSYGDRPGFGSCLTGQGAGPWQVDGSFDMGYIRRLATPYAPVVAGELLGSTWAPAEGRFALRFRPGAQNGTTEVFVNPALIFPSGLDIRVEPDVLDIERDLET